MDFDVPAQFPRHEPSVVLSADSSMLRFHVPSDVFSDVPSQFLFLFYNVHTVPYAVPSGIRSLFLFVIYNISAVPSAVCSNVTSLFFDFPTVPSAVPVSYTHLTLPTIYSV